MYLLLQLKSFSSVSSTSATKYISTIWLLNPFVATISTRGSAESILAVIVLLTFYLLMTRRVISAAFVFGFSVHFKIYPILYALPILLFFDNAPDNARARSWLNPVRWMTELWRFCTWDRVRFGVVSGSFFLALGGAMYYL